MGTVTQFLSGDREKFSFVCCVLTLVTPVCVPFCSDDFLLFHIIPSVSHLHFKDVRLKLLMAKSLPSFPRKPFILRQVYADDNSVPSQCILTVVKMSLDKLFCLSAWKYLLFPFCLVNVSFPLFYSTISASMKRSYLFQLEIDISSDGPLQKPLLPPICPCIMLKYSYVAPPAHCPALSWASWG